jgi:hypothetical protein
MWVSWILARQAVIGVLLVTVALVLLTVWFRD